jgi:hypothetical protein
MQETFKIVIKNISLHGIVILNFRVDTTLRMALYEFQDKPEASSHATTQHI